MENCSISGVYSYSDVGMMKTKAKHIAFRKVKVENVFTKNNAVLPIKIIASYSANSAIMEDLTFRNLT